MKSGDKCSKWIVVIMKSGQNAKWSKWKGAKKSGQNKKYRQVDKMKSGQNKSGPNEKWSEWKVVKNIRGQN